MTGGRTLEANGARSIGANNWQNDLTPGILPLPKSMRASWPVAPTYSSVDYRENKRKQQEKKGGGANESQHTRRIPTIMMQRRFTWVIWYDACCTHTHF